MAKLDEKSIGPFGRELSECLNAWREWHATVGALFDGQVQRDELDAKKELFSRHADRVLLALKRELALPDRLLPNEVRKGKP